MFKYIYSLLVILLLVNSSFAQTVDHWETILKVGDNCQYLVPNSDIGTTWISKDFDDSGWTTGSSGIGYGDGDDNTEIASGTSSVYLRFAFNVIDKSEIERLVIDADYDDGFVAYLNGTEVARDNVDDPISWDMELNDLHEARLYNGGVPESFEITDYINTLLVDGENSLAVEVHNESNTSSDLSSNFFIHVGMKNAGLVYGETPSWFTGPTEPVVFGDYNLPLMIINTNGVEVPKVAPRIVADMGLIYNGEGQMNHESDEWNAYSGKISIKRRGESSSGFAKKSYTIELQNEDGSNNNSSLLGMPEENDFALYGPYSDKTMMKNVLTYELFRLTGRYAPRTRYIEIILNGDYRGVYVLTETIKRDENRVDVDKITSEDISDVDISGGYILRRDKKNELESNEWWTSPVEQPYHERMWYQYFDPQRKDLTDDQANYIKDWMENFDGVMSSNDFSDPATGYSQYIKVKSFIDMMFVNEISKGIDSYLFSTYFHKENDADGGKLAAGAPWDYNLAYGNLNYGDDWDASESYGWAYPQGSRVYWFERLMEDETYRNKAYCRWAEFRSDIFSDENINSLIDSCVNVIGDAAARNFDKYPTLGQYIWPAKPPYPVTYEGEVAQLRTWLMARLEWMDDQWLGQGTCSNLAPTDIDLDNNELFENMPPATEIGTFTVVDPNEGDVIDLDLVGGKGSDDNHLFTISENKLLSLRTFDYETKSSYTIRVSATDQDYEDEEKIFEIYILDEDDQIITSTNNLNQDHFNIYPNPANEGIQITNSSELKTNCQIQIIDMTGIVLFEYKGKIKNINKSLELDTRKLNSGIYAIRIFSGAQLSLLRFIKK
ncbi:MAG: CotH kinase family protein [Reichenbachiella sp.]